MHDPPSLTAGFHLIKFPRRMLEAVVIWRHVSLSPTNQYLLQLEATPDCVGKASCVVVAGTDVVLVVGVFATPTQ